jgi:hypothetical protein
MRYFSITLLVLTLMIQCLSVLLAWAGQPARTIVLAWDASSTPSVSYRLYYGEASGPYTVVLDTGIARTASISGLKPGQLYAFAATAVNEMGESTFSNEVSGRGR